MKLYTGILLVIAALLVGCKGGIKADVPSYIYIDQFIVNDGSGVNAGALTSNITDVWVFVNNQAVGVFELPARIPIIGEGSVNLKIEPGIENNGSSADRVRYPFYVDFDTTLTLYPDSVLNITPSTSYSAIDDLQFFIEDFENPNVKIEEGPSNEAPFTTTNDPALVRSGLYSSYTEVTPTNSISNVATTGWLTLPKYRPVYLELDYKTTNSVLVTTVIMLADGTIVENPYVFLNPQADGAGVWKKIYIDLEDDISYFPAAIQYKIDLLSVLDQGSTSAEILYDNFKIIYAQ